MNTITINYENIMHNFALLKEKVCKNNEEIFPVLKADGYGLNSIKIAEKLLKSDIFVEKSFFVFSIDEAIEYMKIYKGSRFPKEIVDALLQFTAVYPAGSTVLLTNGQTGKVVRQNKEFSDRPVIELKNHYIIDLVKINNVFIEKVLE